MGKKDEKPGYTLEKIKEFAKLPDYTKEPYTKRATVSYDGKSLIVRIPAEVKEDFSLKKGDLMVFQAKKTKKLKDLQISIERS